MAEIHHADGRIELEEKDSQALQESPLYNPDLAPVPLAKRNWTTYNFAALWISMAHCIPTYMLASGLIDSGMSWLQALGTILLGNVIVLVPILLNSHPGTRYGIPFPVLLRASYGSYGANLPALIDALNKSKPASSKGVYLRKVAVSSTMGVGVRVDTAAILAAAA